MNNSKHHWPSTLLSIAVLAFFAVLIAMDKITWLEASPALLALAGFFYKPKTVYGEITSMKPDDDTVFPDPDVKPPSSPPPPPSTRSGGRR